MNYLIIEFGEEVPESEPPWWVNLLTKIIPSANPDLEMLYRGVNKWWLEVDEDGEPLREIGFDESNEPVVLGPVGENYGLLVDSGKGWNAQEYEKLEEEKFQEVWETLWSTFSNLE